MSRPTTFGEAKDKLSNLATTGLSIGDAILTAIEQVYDQARWHGTTAEKELFLSDHYQDTSTYRWYLHLDPTIWNGVIGFRTNLQGFEIQDITALYRRGIPAGEFDYVDMGIIDFNGIQVRSYRCPSMWQPGVFRLWALIKLQPPVIEQDDDVIPILSLSGLRYAVQAVCAESVNDDERAKIYWDKFEGAMIKSQKQYNGPKSMSIKIVSTLRRRPNQIR